MSLWDAIVGRRKVKLTDPASWHVDRGNAAGKSVTPDTALQLSTAWSCTRLLAETIGTLPVGVFRRDPDGSRTQADDHSLFGLLHDSPNADQTAAEFLEALVSCLCLWGNAYAEKVTSGSRTIALTFLRPDLMTVYRDQQGRRMYRYSDPRGQRVMPEDQVFHLRGFGVGGDVGLSPIGYARQTMGAALAADEVAGGIFGSGLHLSGFVEQDPAAKTTPGQLREMAELWAKFTGSKNAGRIMPLYPGTKFVALSMNPEDAQLLQTRAFHVEEICRWFRVPPFMVGHTEKSTSWGTGLEQQMIGFLTFSLRPYLTRIEQAVKKQLIIPGERRTIFAEFNLEGLMRADSAGRAALYASAGQNGWMKRNEIRRKENLPPEDGGDMLTVQSNLVPLDQLGKSGGGSADQQARESLINWLGMSLQSGNPDPAELSRRAEVLNALSLKGWSDAL